MGGAVGSLLVRGLPAQQASTPGVGRTFVLGFLKRGRKPLEIYESARRLVWQPPG